MRRGSISSGPLIQGIQGLAKSFQSPAKSQNRKTTGRSSKADPHRGFQERKTVLRQNTPHLQEPASPSPLCSTYGPASPEVRTWHRLMLIDLVVLPSFPHTAEAKGCFSSDDLKEMCQNFRTQGYPAAESLSSSTRPQRFPGSQKDSTVSFLKSP